MPKSGNWTICCDPHASNHILARSGSQFAPFLDGINDEDIQVRRLQIEYHDVRIYTKFQYLPASYSFIPSSTGTQVHFVVLSHCHSPICYIHNGLHLPLFLLDHSQHRSRRTLSCPHLRLLPCYIQSFHFAPQLDTWPLVCSHLKLVDHNTCFAPPAVQNKPSSS